MSIFPNCVQIVPDKGCVLQDLHEQKPDLMFEFQPIFSPTAGPQKRLRHFKAMGEIL